MSTTAFYLPERKVVIRIKKGFSPGSIRRNIRGHDAGGDKVLNISQLLNYLHELFHFRGGRPGLTYFLFSVDPDRLCKCLSGSWE